MNDTCKNRWNNIFNTNAYIYVGIQSLIDAIIWYNGQQVTKLTKLVLITMTSVWFLTCLCNGLNLWYQMDVFTLYLIMWQFTYLLRKWWLHELPWVSLSLHQGSLCLSMAFLAYSAYNVALRYFPVYFQFAFLWFVAVEDW